MTAWSRVDTGDTEKRGQNERNDAREIRTQLDQLNAPSIKGTGSGAINDCQKSGTIFIFKKDKCEE